MLTDGVEIDLVPRTTLGPDLPDRLRGRLGVGYPWTDRLRPDSDGLTPDLARRIRDEADTAVYFRTKLTVSFEAGRTPIVLGRVEVRLHEHSVRGASQPTIYEFDPLRQTTEQNVRTSVDATVDSSVAGVPGLTIGGRSERVHTTDLNHVTAYITGENIVTWKITPTAAAQIDRSYTFSFVARTSPRVRTRAGIEITATCRTRLGRLFPARAELPPALSTIALDDSGHG